MPEEKKYIELTLVVQPQDLIFADGHYGFISGGSKRVVLHEAQFKNHKKLEMIKSIMWDELLKEKKWNLLKREAINLTYQYATKEIPWKSEPITYYI